MSNNNNNNIIAIEEKDNKHSNLFPVNSSIKHKSSFIIGDGRENSLNDNVIRVLTLGYTGVGKSTFCNFLSGSEHFEESPYGDTCTQEISSFEFQDDSTDKFISSEHGKVLNNSAIEIIDSPGLGEEDSLKDLQNYKGLIKELKRGVDFVILCINFDLRFDSTQVPLIRFYKQLLQNYEQTNRFMIIFTQLTNQDYLWAKDNYISKITNDKGWDALVNDKLLLFKEKFGFDNNFFFEFICSVPASTNNNSNLSDDNVYSLSSKARSNIIYFMKSKGKITKSKLYFPILPRFQVFVEYLLRERKIQIQQFQQLQSKFNEILCALNTNLTIKKEQISYESNKIREIEKEIENLSTDSIIHQKFLSGNDIFKFLNVTTRLPKPSVLISKFVENMMNIQEIRHILPSRGSNIEMSSSQLLEWANNNSNNANERLTIKIKPKTVNLSKIDAAILPNNKNNKSIRWFYFYEIYNDALRVNKPKLDSFHSDLAKLSSNWDKLESEKLEIEAELKSQLEKSENDDKALAELRDSVSLLSKIELTEKEFLILSHYLEDYMKKNQL